MSLHELVNSYISKYGFQNYLEIGVNEGETFEKIIAPLKHAVDIQFKYNFDEKKNENNHYFQMSSDEYFHVAEHIIQNDIVYLDGLHTFEQTLKDLLNVCANSREKALIIIDDVHPIDWFSSLNDQSETYKYRRSHLGEKIHYAWIGDIFKLIPFIHDFLSALSKCSLVGTLKHIGISDLGQPNFHSGRSKLQSYLSIAGELPWSSSEFSEDHIFAST